MNFNKEFSDSLKNKIPKKIKDLGYEFFNPSKGLVRFNNDVLNAVYIQLKPMNDILESLLKFEYINDEFVFKYIYLRYKNDDRYDKRYDENMELDSIYFNPEARVMIKIEERGKKTNIKYGWPNTSKNFHKFLTFLENKKIIDNNKSVSNCKYCFKENCIYLIIEKDKENV